MPIHKQHRVAARPLAPATRRRYRRIVLLGAGTLALVFATTGIVLAGVGGSSPPSEALKPSATAVSPSAIVAGPAEGQLSASVPAAHSSTTKSAAHSTTSAAALADGTYPTYIHEVDVQGATITVDVIQAFEGKDAAKAAVDDGVSPSEADYLYVYIRNQNPWLRTLPVAGDLNVQFAGTCEGPANGHEALTELAKEATPFNPGIDAYYYSITVRDGAIRDITQKLTGAAC